MNNNSYPVPDIDYPAVEDYYDDFPIDEYAMMQSIEQYW